MSMIDYCKLLFKFSVQFPSFLEISVIFFWDSIVIGKLLYHNMYVIRLIHFRRHISQKTLHSNDSDKLIMVKNAQMGCDMMWPQIDSSSLFITIGLVLKSLFFSLLIYEALRQREIQVYLFKPSMRMKTKLILDRIPRRILGPGLSVLKSIIII